MISLFRQLFRFGCIGILSTGVHYVVAILLIALMKKPLWANFFAFVVAFQVSFLGHYCWTFSEKANVNHRRPFCRFLVLAITGFGINQILYFCMLKYSSLSPQFSLFLVTGLVAALTFWMSRSWAFSLSKDSRQMLPNNDLFS